MQFKGYHINNLKSYRKYFCFSDAAEALENGAYEEWLSGVAKSTKEPDTAPGEDVRIIVKIQNILSQLSGCKSPEWKSEAEDRSAGGHIEKLYQNLFMLFFALAQMPVTEEDREKIARAARFGAERRAERKPGENHGKTDSTAEIFSFGEDYEIQVWKNKTEKEDLKKENHFLLKWKKLVNKGNAPIFVLLMDGEHMETSRRLNPGGYVWFLTLHDCFVKWGNRIQVHRRSFAGVDREGHLIVNGHPMRGEGMVDFSFDRRTGILGVDESGNLRQYSALELEIKDGGAGNSDGVEKEKIAFACLDGKTYILVKENGELITNLTDCPADVYGWQAAERESAVSGETIGYDQSEQVRDAQSELPFAAMILSVSDQLAGFETPDSRVGVWDQERKQLIWMER